MLSTKEIKNTQQASHYFLQKDNYYTREEGIQKSEWYGKGAATLQLTGEIDSEQFNALLEGRLPTGQQLGKKVDGEIKHRPGWDLTFSAPKSVSLLALMGGDTRLLEAHRQAVKTALSDIERGCSQVRLKKPAGMIFQNTQNIVASLFHHDLSRAQDPQLHTHCVVFNMTQRIDGQWRSHASQLGNYSEQTEIAVNGFIERVRHHKRYYGQLYRNELAYQVKQLGYEITVDRKTGFFEIAGISHEVIDHFSQRRRDIVAHLEEQDLAGGKASALATLKTRESKKIIERGVLAHLWEQRAQSLGFDCKKIRGHCASMSSVESVPLSTQQTKEDETAQIALQQAAHELSRFQATFTLETLITLAARYSIHHTVRTESLLTALKSLVSSGELIELPNTQQKTVLMAKTTLDAEQRLMVFVKEVKTNHPFVGKDCFETFFAQHSELSRSQQQQLRILFNEQPLVIVEGNHTKESLIEPVVHIAKAARLSVAIISPHSVGSKRLANALEQKPQTLWERIKAFWVDNTLNHYSALSFLSRFSARAATANTPRLLLIDHAHLIPTQVMADLAEWASHHQAKLLLFGEQQKLLPQQTGTPFHQLIANGAPLIRTLTTASPERVTPLKNNSEKIADRIVEIKQRDDRLQAMAAHYARLPTEVRQQSWLVTTNKKTVDALNNLTHRALSYRGWLGKSVEVSVLIPVFLSRGKERHALSYSPDHWVRFNQNVRLLAIKRGDYLRVIRVDKALNSVLLEKRKGKSIVWRPDKIASSRTSSVELFELRTRVFSVGEQVVLHRTLSDKKLLKGERFTLSDCHATTITLRNDQQQSFQLDCKKPHHCHFDYGYASTLHAISYEQPHTLIAELPARSIHTHQRQWNQLCSQPQHGWLYTDDLPMLAALLEQRTGDRLTAQAILTEATSIKQQVHTLYDILEEHLSKAAVNKSLSHSAVDAIDYAIQHVAEREAGFTHKQIMEIAMSHALGDVSQTDLLHAIQAAEKAGIFLKGHREDGTLWTTLAAVTLEREIIRLCQHDKGQLQPIASDATVQKYTDFTQLNAEQIAAVKATTQNTDRILAVQGYAGTGKTTMLQAVQSVLNEQNYQLLGVAPTHPAVKELQQRGIPAQTLDSFIVSTQQLMSETLRQPTQVLVLDEASLVSNRKMLTLLQVVHQIGCRLVIVGDSRQLPAIEAGKPQSLMHTQLETITLTNIQRQHDPLLKQAVKETIQYDFNAVFKTLASSIVEINEKTSPAQSGFEKSADTLRLERLDHLVQDYFSYPKEIRASILIITPGHDDRLLTNTLIRDHLKQEGLLTGHPESFPILLSQSLTQVERSHISAFVVGDTLRFGKSERMDIKAGEYVTVTGIHPKYRLLSLQTADGRDVSWQIPSYREGRLSAVEVFKTDIRELQMGDSIRWTRTDKTRDLLSAELATVTAVSAHQVTVERANKTLFTFDPRVSTYQHWEHGYASTVYAAQGSTKSIVLAHLESFRTNLTTQPAFLVALTRAVDTFCIYTDDKVALLKRIQKNAGLKRSSLEVIGEYPSYAKTTEKDLSTQSPTQHKEVMKNNEAVFVNRSQSPYSNTSQWDPSTLHRLRDALNHDAENVAIALLGKPVARHGNTLRFGSNKGSLIVTVSGAKQGLWYDFAPDKTSRGKSGGDMLTLIQIQKGLRYRDSLRYAAQWLHISLDGKESRRIKTFDTRTNFIEKTIHRSLKREWSREQKNKIALAKRFARQSIPIRGTLAERYLKEHRGIRLEKYPKDIRFHSGIYSKINGKTLPALLVIARDSHHRLQAVQAIYLNETTGQKIDKVVAPIQKQTFGVLRGAEVTLSATHNTITVVAEGPETGLSLAQSLPNATVKVTLGKRNVVNLDDQSLGSTVVFCLDNDNKPVKDDPVLIAAIGRLVERGKDVRIMMPHGLGDIKQDYNDVLRQKGESAIRHDFDKAVPCERFFDRSFSKTTINPSFEHKREHYSSLLQTSNYPERREMKVMPPRQKEVEIER